MNVTGFRVIAWGLLLVVLDFNINGFDLLPDWLGYIIIISGCHQLSNQLSYSQFRHANLAAYALLFIYIVNILMLFSATSDSTIGLIDGIMSVMMIVFMYYICDGLFHFAQSIQESEFSQAVRRNWLFYFIANLIALISQPLLLLNSSFSIIMVVLIITVVLSTLFIIFKLFKAAKFHLPPTPTDHSSL
ncbi:hypothetical protein ACFSTH_09335 [Paenibacillus yanchengensis]|uniref:Integral membrane protein n=1 Tax=Paenibacillus yanchengensis TaxID=2035833 RepID=A0ABW4YGF2_9BACL